MPAQVEAAPSSTTSTPNVAQLRFRDRFGRNRPPDQAIAREAFAAAVEAEGFDDDERQSWRRGGRTVSAHVVWAVFMALYGRSSYGRASTTLEKLAGDCRLSTRAVVDAMQVLRVDLALVVAVTEPRRGLPTVYEIRPAGMTWRMACHLAANPEAENPQDPAEPPPNPAEPEPPVDPPTAPPPSTGSGDTGSGLGDRVSPRRVLGFTNTTTTPPKPPDGGPPPSTPRQRAFARDLGADVDALDVAAAGKVIELARYKRAAAAALSPPPPGRRGPGRRRGHQVPASVRAQAERSAAARKIPIEGCPAAARRNRIMVLELAIQRHGGNRTDRATVEGWHRELNQLLAENAEGRK